MHEWLDDANVMKVYNYLVSKIGYERKYKGELLAYNEHICTVTEIIEITGLTRQNIRTALNKLERTGYIKRETTNSRTKVIVNG